MITGQEIDPVLYGMLVDRRLRASRALRPRLRQRGEGAEAAAARPDEAQRRGPLAAPVHVRKTATKDEEQPTKDAQPSITVQAPPPAPTVMTRPAPPPFDHMSRTTKPGLSPRQRSRNRRSSSITPTQADWRGHSDDRARRGLQDAGRGGGEGLEEGRSHISPGHRSGSSSAERGVRTAVARDQRSGTPRGGQVD